ncbi:sigma factor-like helix-turn-helix DNA-binding protein [Streptomyces sp900105755]|uniref:sigma factor-like helix-turn-helix DNA-binding protein n=1 Tax=Streptomyces sp. 900105755 TaxID=3154389 RepID=UPI00332C7627
MFAAVCVLLAALGHVLMSGSRVPAWALAAALALTGAPGWALSGRERGLPLVVSAAVGTQTAQHQLVGLPYAEAAEVGGCPVGTVRSRVARAREALRDQLA